RDQVRRLLAAAATRDRTVEKGRAAQHSGVVRLRSRERAVARNAGEADQDSSADAGSRLAHSRGNACGGFAGERLYRDTGEAPPTSCSNMSSAVRYSHLESPIGPLLL